MAWTTPKTDWVSTDSFNIEDYNRIKNNLTYLHETTTRYYADFDIEDMGDDIEDYSSYWDVDMFNAIEENLETISQQIDVLDIGDKQVFYENGAFIQYDELNRIESAMVSIKDILNQIARASRLTFRLGAYKAIQL